MLNIIEANEHIVIDDVYIDRIIKGETPNPFRIVAPLFWSISIYNNEEKYYKDLAHFSTAQKYLFALDWYMAEVNNGGHSQFYGNSTGIVWEEVLNAFKELNLNEYLNNFNETLQKFSTPPSKDRNERDKQLHIIVGSFDVQDKKFYELEKDSLLNKTVINYINSNRDQFYFDGIVKTKRRLQI